MAIRKNSRMINKLQEKRTEGRNPYNQGTGEE